MSNSCKNDVLVFVAIAFDKVIISMGSAAKKIISNKELDELIHEATKQLASESLHTSLEGIIQILQQKANFYKPVPIGFDLNLGIFSLTLIGFVLAITIVALLWCFIERNRKKSDRRKTAQISAEKTTEYELVSDKDQN
ncbi:hypothetical protein SSS_08918 [Sarcoptes scabiei]|nr:hypothetical protein SSS_08918 [Sarcoptes scabiei]